MKISTTSAFTLATLLLLSACDGAVHRQVADSGNTGSTTGNGNGGGDGGNGGSQNYSLSVTPGGNGLGRVSSTPSGIDCGSQCSTSFAADTVVQLNAVAESGSRFDGWSGDCTGTDPCSLKMSATHQVGAQFSTISTPRYTLTVSSSGNGNGTISSTPSGIDCGAQCAAEYSDGTHVTLRAAADAVSQFSGWSGDCSGSGDCMLTMDRAHNTVASFTQQTATPATRSWLYGDTHVHDDHSSDGSLPRQTIGQDQAGNLSVADQIGFAEFSGLNFLPLTDHRTYDQHYDPLWQSSKLLLIPGEEANGSPHATVHGAIDTIVQGGSPPGLPDFVRLQQSIWDAHAQGASWGTAHPDDGETNDDGTPNGNANAQGIDTVEAWNKASGVEKEINYAENRWNAGFRFGVVGACDDHFKELWVIAGPGMPSTGVLAARNSTRGVVQALQNGNTIVRRMSGSLPVITAMLEADMSNAGTFAYVGGDEITAASGTPGKLRISVYNGFGSTVSLFRSPGRSAGAIKTFQPTSIAMTETYLVDIVASDKPVWYRVEVRGPGLPAGIDTNALRDPLNNLTNLVTVLDELQALTSPVFIAPSPVHAQPAIPVPDDIGSDDSAALALGDSGHFVGFPALASDGGVTHVVAETHGSGNTGITYRRRDSSGAWSATVELAPASLQARFPKIAARGDSVWVAWQDARGGEMPHRRAIYLRHSDDGGKHWQPEVALRSVAGRAEHPDLTLLADGSPVVVWQEIGDAIPFDVWVQRVGIDTQPLNLSGSGKNFHAASGSDTRSALYPASVWPVVAVAPDGSVAVAWQDNRTDKDPLWTGGAGYTDGTDPDNWQIMLRTLTPGASTWSAAVSLGTDDRADRHPALTFAADGRLVTAWDSKTLNSSGANLSIRSAISSDAGAHWSAPVAVAENGNAMSQWPKLGRAIDGSAQLVWYDSRSSDWRWRVMSATLGSNWSNGSVIPSPGINSWPAISNGNIAFASTRNAQRLQRDRTQQIFLLQNTSSR